MEILGRRLENPEPVAARVARILNLHEDLSVFYEVAARDPDLSWAATGARRMLCSRSVQGSRQYDLSPL